MSTFKKVVRNTIQTAASQVPLQMGYKEVLAHKITEQCNKNLSVHGVELVGVKILSVVLKSRQ